MEYNRPMATRRSYGSYDDGCAAAHALDVVGERWALLVVRELILGPKRFTDIRAGVPGASANLLSQRLRELEEAGVLQRRTLGPPSGANVYELTEWGLGLETVLQALGRWGAQSPAMPHGASIGTDTMILALRTMFDPEAARGIDVTLEFRFGRDRFRGRAADGEMLLERGSAKDAAAIVTTEASTLTHIVFHGRSLDEAIAAGEVRVEGDRGALQRFLAIFPSLGAVGEAGVAS
ncbi:MAG: transcriptional regulator, HxlR family [Candidatus Eremiobacteraeota bacterium]|nr:transcriptional regulator, HxlR family [Candidatus Eremiobacteraeota bacterium]